MNTDDPEDVIAQALYYRDIKSFRTDSTYDDDARDLIDAFGRAGFKIVRNEDGSWSWRKARGVLASKEGQGVSTQHGDTGPTIIVGPEATSIHETDVCSVSLAAGPDGVIYASIFEHTGVMLGRHLTIMPSHIAAEVDLTKVAQAIWDGMIARGNIRGMTYAKAVVASRNGGNWRELVEQVNYAALTAVMATNALRAGRSIEPTPCISCGRPRADSDVGDYCATCAIHADAAMPVVNQSTRPRSGVRSSGSTITRVSVQDDDQ